MQLDELELYYLRRTILMRVDTLERQLARNQRYFRDTDDDILYQNKIGNLESEVLCLKNVKENINREIAYVTMRGNVDFRE